jgi:uncharacterized membrane protein
MDNKLNAVAGQPGAPDLQAPSTPGPFGRFWGNIFDRILGGLLLVLPLLITLWIIGWLYSFLELKIIDPLAALVLWKFKWTTSSTELPYWFEKFVAPVIAILLALTLLYYCDYFSDTRLRRGVSWLLRRVPVVSHIYNPVQTMFQTLAKQSGEQRLLRLVLIKFPHPGMKLPAFVTAICQDSETKKTLLCVYVPTTPVPTSGFFLLVPEEEVTELNWDSEQTLQAIISGGLTAPPVVSFFKTGPASDIKPPAALVPGGPPPEQRDGDRSHPT